MLSELQRRRELGGEGFDVFDLAFCDCVEDVAGPLLDEGDKGAVAEGAVRATEGKCVGKVGDAHAEVRRHAFFCVPEVAQVVAVGDEGETREPRGVEACCADYYVDGVGSAVLVDETGWCYGADGVGEDGCVFGDEGFEVAGCGCWAATSRVEVFWYHLLCKTWVVVELGSHFLGSVFACEVGFFTALDDEFEALVQLILDLFAILEVLLGVFGKVPELLFTVWGS